MVDLSVGSSAGFAKHLLASAILLFSTVQGQAFQIVDYEPTLAVTAEDICSEPLTELVARRSPLNSLHGDVLALLSSDLPRDDPKRVSAAKALVPVFLSAINGSMNAISGDDLGILLYDLAALLLAAKVPSDQISAYDVKQEATALLSKATQAPQAIELAAELATSLLGDNRVTTTQNVLDNHIARFGNRSDQWALFARLVRNLTYSQQSAEQVEREMATLVRRIEWARSLQNERLELESIGTWLLKASEQLTKGLQPTPGQLAPLLPTARSLFDRVEARALKDLELLIPIYEAGGDNRLDCRNVSTATVDGIFNVIMAEGTPQERGRVLEFAVLHSLDTYMFETDPFGVMVNANPLLQLRMSNPDLFARAAGYVSTALTCPAEQPKAACSEGALANVYNWLNRGTLALDLARTSYERTINGTQNLEARSGAALQLAFLEWEYGSVGRAADLMNTDVAVVPFDWKALDYRDAQTYVDVQYSLAKTALDDTAIEALLRRTMAERREAEIAGAGQVSVAFEAPLPDAMIQDYLLGGACQTCPDDLRAEVVGWVKRAASGSSHHFLLTRLLRDNELSEAERGALAEKLLLKTVEFDSTNLRATLKSLPTLRGRGMTMQEQATVLALAEGHPHASAIEGGWLRDFAAFLFEGNIERKRKLYNSMIASYDSVSMDFGTERDYLNGLDGLSRLARTVGYSLAAQVLDEHIVQMIDEKLGYMDTEVTDATLNEDAWVLTPALARLARGAFGAEDVKRGVQLLARARASALQSLNSSWTVGDQRAVMKFRELESALRLTAQLSINASTARPELIPDALESVQMAMLGDTALTALAAQRRRVLVNPLAQEALEDAEQARSALQLLNYYKSEVGIQDPAWEARELSSRTAALETANLALTAHFPDAQAFSLQPVSIDQVRAVLKPGELVVVVHSGTDATYGLAVSTTLEKSWVSAADSAKLDETVAKIRDAVSIEPGQPLPVNYPFAEAHQLFLDIFGDAVSHLPQYDRLLIVVDGPLQRIPLSVLPMNLPSHLPTSPADFRGLDVQWLGATKAIVHLPTLGAIRARDVLPQTTQARPFAGIGDPSLGMGNLEAGISSAVYADNGLADVNYLRSLASLPETKTEIFALAQMQKASAGDVLVGEQATETNIKAMKLSEYSVILFATHGLVAGEARGVSEPGLVLTPPTEPTSLDDGYLGLGEVMDLELSAELVILSACNTAAGDGRSNASGLSGLARVSYCT